MIDIKKQLREVSCMFSRQQGHTSAALLGAVNVPNTTVVCHNNQICDALESLSIHPTHRKNVRYISFNDDTANRLIGNKGPIILDHVVVQNLCRNANRHIENMEKYERSLESKLATVEKENKVLSNCLEAAINELSKSNRYADVECLHGIIKKRDKEIMDLKSELQTAKDKLDIICVMSADSSTISSEDKEIDELINSLLDGDESLKEHECDLVALIY